jgi:hypothetical protein
LSNYFFNLPPKKTALLMMMAQTAKEMSDSAFSGRCCRASSRGQFLTAPPGAKFYPQGLSFPQGQNFTHKGEVGPQ